MSKITNTTDKGSNKLLHKPLSFPLTIPFKNLMVNNTSKIVSFFCPLPNLFVKIYYFLKSGQF